MDVQTQSALLAAMILAGLAVHVATDRRSVKFRKTFVLLLATASLFYSAIFLNLVLNHPWFLAAIGFSALSFFNVLVRFFQRVTRHHFLGTKLCLFIGTGLWFCLGIADIVLDIKIVRTQQVNGLILFGLLASFAHCHWILYRQKGKVVLLQASARTESLVAAGFTTCSFGILDLLALHGVSVPPLGALITTAYFFVWMHVVLRSRILDLKEYAVRGLSLLLISLLLTFVYIMMFRWTGHNLSLLTFNVVALSMLVFYVFEPTKKGIARFAGRVITRSSSDFQTTLRQLQSALRMPTSPSKIAEVLFLALTKSERFTHLSFFVIDDTDQTFKCLRSTNDFEPKALSHETDHILLDSLVESPLISLHDLLDTQADFDEMPEPVRKHRINALIQALTRLNCQFSFPLMQKNRLIGILNVADNRTAEPFSSLELHQLARATAIIASGLAASKRVQRIKDRERMSAVGEMAAGMAHEIRNPLGAIKSAAQLLVPSSNDPDGQQMIQIIVDEANRLDNVLADFLDFAKPTSATLAAVQMTKVFEKSIALFSASHPHIKFEVTIDEDLPLVLGNADYLHQIFLNLVRNSIQAIGDQEGRITLKAKVLNEIHPRVTRPSILVSVEDTGPGLSKKATENLCVPFFTTKQKGTGLGLAMCQKLLTLHGSKVEVWTEANIGTRISFRLFQYQDGVRNTNEHLLRAPKWSSA